MKNEDVRMKEDRASPFIKCTAQFQCSTKALELFFSIGIYLSTEYLASMLYEFLNVLEYSQCLRQSPGEP